MILDFSPDFSTHFAHIREFLAKFPELLQRRATLAAAWNPMEHSGTFWNVLECSGTFQ